MNKLINTIAFLCLAFGLWSCGGNPPNQQYEDYQIRSTADLVLTQQNHPHGYSKTECWVCHNPSNIHRIDRLGAPNFDLAQILVQQSGLASCAGCHGRNGNP